MRNKHYTPQIARPLVTRIYFAAKAEQIPMTKLVDRIVGDYFTVREVPDESRVAEQPSSVDSKTSTNSD